MDPGLSADRDIRHCICVCVRVRCPRCPCPRADMRYETGVTGYGSHRPGPRDRHAASPHAQV